MPYLIHPKTQPPVEFEALTPSELNERAKAERILWYDCYDRYTKILPYWGKDYAEAIGVNEKTISRWKNRKTWPHKSSFDALLEEICDFRKHDRSRYADWVRHWIWGNRLITVTHEHLLPEADLTYAKFVAREGARSESEWIRLIERSVAWAEIPFRGRNRMKKETIDTVEPTGAFPAGQVHRDRAGRVIGVGVDRPGEDPISMPDLPKGILK